MRRRLVGLLALILSVQTTFPPAIQAAQDAAKIVQPSQTVVALGNQDIIEMLRAKLSAEVILAKIKTSPANFDTSPEALKQLQAEGAGESVLLAMVNAPRNAHAGEEGAGARVPAKVTVRILKGTVIDVETAYEINSQLVREGDAISFRVVNPVKVGDVTVIEPGATATARVVKASRGGHFGRAGRLGWTLQDVTAVDGTRVAVEATGRTVGDSKGAKVATQTVLTGLMLWPIAPVALLHGFKRGENAIVPAGKRFTIFVRSDSTVQGRQLH